MTNPPTHTVPLYRIENPNIPPQPDGVISHQDLVGQWFTSDQERVVQYLAKSMRVRDKTKPYDQRVTSIPGAQLVTAHVNEGDLAEFHASQHPVAAQMEYEPHNYIVPRDGSVPVEILPLDQTVGDLAGEIDKPQGRRAARQRIAALIHDSLTVEK